VTFRLAWRNTTHQKLRTTLALSAIAFAVVLLFMQLALYDACNMSAHILLDMLDFDAVLISSEFSSLQRPSSFPRARLNQALQDPAVQSVSPVYTASLPWRNVENGSRHIVFILGAAPGDPVFLDPAIRERLPRLHQTGCVLMDRQMLPLFGPAREGLVSEVGSHSLTVVGLFRNGAGFNAGGLMVASDQTMSRLGVSLDRAMLGLLKFKPGEDPGSRVVELRKTLPPDVKLLTRAELVAQEVYYWTKGKPIGIMFSSGVYVGIIVAAIILYQLLAADISRRLREYATMKAMGFSELQINGAVLQQALLVMLVSFALGLVLSFGLYAVIAKGTGFPMKLTLHRAVLVFGLILVVTFSSGVLALRKLRAADPADLF